MRKWKTGRKVMTTNNLHSVDKWRIISSFQKPFPRSPLFLLCWLWRLQCALGVCAAFFFYWPSKWLRSIWLPVIILKYPTNNVWICSSRWQQCDFKHQRPASGDLSVRLHSAFMRLILSVSGTNCFAQNTTHRHCDPVTHWRVNNERFVCVCVTSSISAATRIVTRSRVFDFTRVQTWSLNVRSSIFTSYWFV